MVALYRLFFLGFISISCLASGTGLTTAIPTSCTGIVPPYQLEISGSGSSTGSTTTGGDAIRDTLSSQLHMALSFLSNCCVANGHSVLAAGTYGSPHSCSGAPGLTCQTTTYPHHSYFAPSGELCKNSSNWKAVVQACFKCVASSSTSTTTSTTVLPPAQMTNPMVR